MKWRAGVAILFLTTAIGLAVAIWTNEPPNEKVVTLRAEVKGQFEPHAAVTWKRESIGPSRSQPRIANVQIVDLDEDGSNDLLVCDAGRHRLELWRQVEGTWKSEILADHINTPARAAVVDLDGDGDRDIVVAALGDIFPSDEMIGQVVLLENTERGYQKKILLDDVHRVADVQAGDFDQDGDWDLAVAVFGYAHGEVLWLEQREGGGFVDHHILDRPGTIHVPVGDYDGDGDLDIVTVSSQDEEEVWGLENDGDGHFKKRRLWFTPNYDVGSGGLVRCDLDRDGDLDLLLPLGDNLEHGYGWPQSYHGCLWLENQGGWKFQPRRVASFGGTYAVAPGDFDGDRDTDLCLVSMSNDWNRPDHASVLWLENDGSQKFKPWRIDTDPVELVTVDAGDLDGDGRDDVVAGCLHIPPSVVPRVHPVTIWLNSP